MAGLVVRLLHPARKAHPRQLGLPSRHRTCPPPRQYEGVLESLKNLLLVMSTHACFQDQDAQEFGPVHLWKPTWEVLNPILPTLKEELFPPPGAQDPAHPGTGGGNFSPRAPKTPMNAR
jgi:hypothetical protein